MNVEFAIIIPTYNRPKMLAKAIRSIDYQSYRNYEIIVVHDGVDCKEDFKDFPDPHELHYYSSKKLGSGGAREIGLKFVPKDRLIYVLYLDDDDELANDSVLEDLASFIEQKNYPTLVRMGYIKHFVSSGVKKVKLIDPAEEDIDKLILSSRVSGSCTAVHSTVCAHWLPNIRHQDVVHHIEQCDILDGDKYNHAVWDKPFFIYNVYDKPEAALDSPENKLTAKVVPEYLQSLVYGNKLKHQSANKAAIRWAEFIKKRYNIDEN